MTESNLHIWQQVETTKTTDTKPINFGRKFTAIDAHSQIKKATEVFGPIGLGWGVINSEYKLLVVDPNDPNYTILQFTAQLWYIHRDMKNFFDISADIEMYSKTRNGWKRTEDSHKKVKTDAVTKGLSWLGFNADVFMGMFDDNKYVSQLKQQEAEANTQPEYVPKAQRQAPQAPAPQQNQPERKLPSREDLAAELKALKSEIWALAQKMNIDLKSLHELALIITNQTLETLDMSNAKKVLKHLQDQKADVVAAENMKESA